MKKIILLFTVLVSFFISGYSQAGRLDPSFGNRGISVSDLGKAFNYSLQGKKVFLQPDGSFFAVQQAEGSTIIAKNHPDGSLDSSYGRNGFSNFAPVSAIDAAIQPDGKIVVLNENFVLARFNNNGIADSAFGKNGLSNSANFGGTSGSNSVAIQKDGKIIVVGYTAVNSNYYFAVCRYNADGSLDKTFSNDGKVITDFGFLQYSDPDQGNSEFNYANAAGIQSDGKIVVVGEVYNYSIYSRDFAIARYNTDGKPDSTFSADGKQTTNFGSDDNGYSLAFQKDGKIVVAGYTSTQDGSYNVSIARYNTNGSPDKTFDGDGKKTTSAGTQDFLFNSLAISNSGKIILASHTWNGSNNDFAINRYNANGGLDSTFDGDGKLTTDFGSSDDYATSIAVDSDGKILLIGYSYTNANLNVSPNSVLVRYNVNGTLDNAFGKEGKLIENFHQGNTSYTSSGVQKDGKLVTAGYTWNGNNYDFAIARYNTNGKLDYTFASNGVQITDFGSTEYEPRITIQDDGKIVLAGTTGLNNSKFILMRYNTNGSIDSAFGNGKQSTAFGFSSATVNAIAIQRDGKIVVGCSVADSNFNIGFLLARYNTNGSIDNTFDRDGIQTTFGKLPFFIGNSIAVQSDGKIVAAGYNSDDFELVRFNANGTFDNTFGREGIQTTDFGLTDEAASSVVIQSDGKIIAAGGGRGNEGVFLLARYNTNGSLDTAFSRDGKQTNNFGHVFSLALESDGKILAGGTFNGNFDIARYNKDGRPDSTFGNNGLQITDISGADDRLKSVSVSSNKLYAAGYGQSLGINGVVASYLLDNGSINKSPVVSLATPYNIVKYSAPANIKLNATALDSDGTISKVEFYKGTTLLHTETVIPYGYLWKNVTAGSYTLTAKAYDNSGNVTASNVIKISVVNYNVPPVVSIVTPGKDTTYKGPATVRLIAAAKDPNDKISKVEFFSGKTLLRTEHYFPYTYWWNNVQPGTYTLTAVATDDKGLSGTSAPVTVTVTSQGATIVSSRPLGKESKTGENNAISLKLYPNPAKNVVSINTTGLQQSKSTSISVMSASGVVVKTIQSNASSKVVQLDVSFLTSGVYTVKITSGDKVMYKQFVKL